MPETRWEIEGGLALFAIDVRRANNIRNSCYATLLKLFERYDYIALPTTRVCPFPLNHDWPTQIAGRPKETYHRWIEVAVP